MGEPIRVAQIMGYMNGGGVESVVMNYYRHIDRKRVQFDLIVCEGSTLVPVDEVEALGGRVFMVPPYSRVIEYQCALFDLFHDQGWQIVHSHINTLSVFSLFAANRAGVPIRIAHSHSTSGRGELAKNCLKGILKTTSNIYPTHRLACSQYAGKWLFGLHENVVVLPNAIDLDQFRRKRLNRESVRLELGIGNDEFVIGHIGRFMEQKNHKFLLQVFKQVLEIRRESRLLLAGKGELLGDIQNMAQNMGIFERVLFLGQRDDIARLYSAMDMFCLPSLYEGLPVVGVESQAAGVPILMSSDVTKEIEITSIAERMSLDRGAAEWAEELIRNSVLSLSEEDESSLLSYDIRRCSKRLEDYYLSAIREAGCDSVCR